MNRSAKNFLLIFLATSCQLSALSAFCSEIYRIVDETGRVTYTDRAANRPENVRQITIPLVAHRQLFSVKHVYDGDTIILENDQRVRLLGINTPEIASRHRDEEPGGVAAKTWLKNRIGDRKIYLEQDQEKQDKYQRQLAHVFLADGTHLNLELIKHGLAFMSIIPPNVRHALSSRWNRFHRPQEAGSVLRAFRARYSNGVVIPTWYSTIRPAFV